MSASVINKEPCQKCIVEGLDTTGDNCVTFESGVQHCHRHGVIGVPHKQENNNLSSKGDLLDGIYCDIRSRKISKETCEFYGYKINAEKKVHIAQWFDEAGNVVMQQLRHPTKSNGKKSFEFRGNTERYGKELTGMHKFQPNEKKFITITEGQIDMLSLGEIFGCNWPVVSLPNGASAAYEVIKHNLPKLLKFKHVVLAFDNDEPGRLATEECLGLFPPGKVRVASWRRKDANEHLVADEYSEMKDIIHGAVAYVPSTILTGDSLLERLDGYSSRTLDWPWKTLKDNLSPISVPSVITVAALPNTGKTILMAELIKHFIGDGRKVGIISLEESIPHLVLKLASKITGVPLNKIHDRQLTDEEKDLCKWVTDSLVTFDHEAYGSDLEAILDALPYIARSLDCEVVIFDNLSYSATNTRDDERRHIDKAMIALKDSSTKHDFVLFNVAHLNQDDTEAKAATMRGSRGIFMYSDYVLYLDRDIESEDVLERNTLKFYVKKDRATGEDVGKFLKMYYNQDKQCLEDFK